MKWRKWISNLVVLALIVTLCPVSASMASSTGNTVNIPDPAFLAYLNRELDEKRPSNTPITQEEMANITSINTRLAEEQITNIEGISAAVNLEKLTTYGDITGLDQIASLKNLTSLTVTDNKYVEDLSFLGEKPHLTSLTVEYVPNMTTLQGLTPQNCPSLTTLDLSRNSGLVDISALGGVAFPHLTELDFSDSPAIPSISALRGYTSLTNLNLEKVEITAENRADYRSTVAGLTSLTRLTMAYCEITDADAQAMFPPLSNLKYLVLNVNDLTKVDFLQEMTADLTTLGLYGNDIADLSPVVHFPNLEILGFSDNYVTDFSFVSHLPKLTNGSVRHSEGTTSYPTTSRYVVGQPDDPVEIVNGTLSISNPYVQPTGAPVSFADAVQTPNDSEYTLSYDAGNNKIILENLDGNANFYVNYQLPVSNGDFKVCKLYIYVYAEHAHTWGETTYTWAEDGSSCTASRVCQYDAAHAETAKATITQEQSKAPTCTQMGQTTYTATFSEDWAATQTLTLDNVAMLPHSYGEAWKWDTTHHFHVCDSCGAKADAAPHTFQWVTDSQAGKKYQECTICGYQLTAEPLPTPSATPAPTPAPTAEPKPVPPTGDSHEILLWVALLVLCAGVLPLVYVKKRNMK